MTFFDPYNPVIVIAAGTALGLSLVYLIYALPVFRTLTLVERLEPYLRNQPMATSSLLEAPPGSRSGISGLLTEWARDFVSWFSDRIGTSTSLEHRLRRLGRGHTVEQFRAGQLVFAVAGLGAGVVVALLIFGARGFNPLLLVGLMVFGVAGGYLFADWWLGQRIKAREERILAEFPTIAELLALSITAGESAVGALERVTSRCHGDLAEELSRALARTRTGTPLVEALDDMAATTSIQSVSQFVDGISVAVRRGSPLADVLRAQASDVREASRRQLLESGGKKEVGMLIPVVMFVLPITVVFAIFPSLFVLNLGV